MRGLVEVRGFVLWGDVVLFENGAWMRLSLDDWRYLKLDCGDPFPLRLRQHSTRCLRAIEIREDGSHVLVTCGKAEFALPTDPATAANAEIPVLEA